jgi:hypothetical protein
MAAAGEDRLARSPGAAASPPDSSAALTTSGSRACICVCVCVAPPVAKASCPPAVTVLVGSFGSPPAPLAQHRHERGGAAALSSFVACLTSCCWCWRPSASCTGSCHCPLPSPLRPQPVAPHAGHAVAASAAHSCPTTPTTSGGDAAGRPAGRDVAPASCPGRRSGRLPGRLADPICWAPALSAARAAPRHRGPAPAAAGDRRGA